jgi:hypothetical protein
MSEKVIVRLKNGECAKRALPTPPTKGLTISAAVGHGGSNLSADVRAIQGALNLVPVASGGPTPALAVDGLVGSKTLAAIGAFQRLQFDWSDSRVDPESITIATLRTYLPDTPGGPLPPPPPPRNKATLRRVYDTISNARRLIAGAKRYAASSREYLRTKSKGHGTQQDKDRYATLNVFFSLDNLPDAEALAAVERINTVFTNMEKALSHNGYLANNHAIFQFDPLNQTDIYAYTFLGGFTRRDNKGGPKMSNDDNYEGPNLREDSIYICRGLDGHDGDFTAYNTVHELAHWVGPEINKTGTIEDFSYRHRNGFYSLPPATALRTADSYAMFAVAASDRGLAEDAFLYMPPMVIYGTPPKK